MNTPSTRSSTDFGAVTPTIVKLGGSLLNLSGLPECLSAAIADVPVPVLVVGGGAAADRVRKWYQAGWLTDDEAHWQAIAAMTCNAVTLAGSNDGFALVDSIECATQTYPPQAVPVLDVFAVLRQLEGSDVGRNVLPSSWDVTSDSIAAWLSGVVKGPLRLLKSVNAGPNPAQHLDRYFPFAASHLAHVEWLNLRTASSVVEVVSRGMWQGAADRKAKVAMSAAVQSLESVIASE